MDTECDCQAAEDPEGGHQHPLIIERGVLQLEGCSA